MVKRAISIVLGAVAGVALWFAFDTVRADELLADPSAEGCLFDKASMSSCVGYVAPVEALRPVSAAAPCKAWLGGSDVASIAMLSKCLRAARQGTDAARLEQVKRARAIAASS
jgi:nitrogen fixation-related uncharacterized protein